MRNGGMLGDGAMEFVELAEADGRVDVVAQERFACLHAAGQKTIDRLLEKRLAKGGVALEPFLTVTLKSRVNALVSFLRNHKKDYRLTSPESYEAAERRRDERTRSGGLMGTNAVAGNR